MELRKLLKNTSYLIFTKVIKFIVGMIRAKFIAVYIGTLGSGIMSQLTQVTQAMSQFTLLGMNDGLVKQIAESDKERSDYRAKLLSLIKSYFVLISITLVLTIILALIYSNKLTIYILGDIKYYNYFIIGLVSFPILVLNSISYALLTSYKLIKYIARSELILVVLNLFIFIPLLKKSEATLLETHIILSQNKPLTRAFSMPARFWTATPVTFSMCSRSLRWLQVRK